jgi:surface antigen
MVAEYGLASRSIRAVVLVGSIALAGCAVPVTESGFLPPTPANITAQITPQDARLATNALMAALNSNTFQERRWRNDQNGHEGAITTVRSFDTANNTKCVEYRDLMQVRAGQSAIAVNTACLVGGEWMIMSADGGWRPVG